jgi:hypothetical protein
VKQDVRVVIHRFGFLSDEINEIQGALKIFELEISDEPVAFTSPFADGRQKS